LFQHVLRCHDQSFNQFVTHSSLKERTSLDVTSMYEEIGLQKFIQPFSLEFLVSVEGAHEIDVDGQLQLHRNYGLN